MIVHAIDLGGHTLSVVMANVEFKNTTYEIEVIGSTSVQSIGIRDGVITNMQILVPRLKNAIQQAEHMAGRHIKHCFVSINGTHIQSYNVKADISLSTGEGQKPISEADITRVRDHARSLISIPADKNIIHILPQQYILDDVPGIMNPLGMTASRLAGEFHLITASRTVLSNVWRCMQELHVKLDGVVHAGLASALGVTNDLEREQGVLVIDIGHHITNLTVLHGNSVFFTGSLPYGGYYFTSDIATELQIQASQAERIKRTISQKLPTLRRIRTSTPTHEKFHHVEQEDDSEEFIELEGTLEGESPRYIPARVVEEIINARSTELMVMVHEMIESVGMYEWIHHVVLTGGGAVVSGILNEAQKVFGLNVRLGTPLQIMGATERVDTPFFATCVGIVHYVCLYEKESLIQSRHRPRFSNLFQWVKNFFT